MSLKPAFKIRTALNKPDLFNNSNYYLNNKTNRNVYQIIKKYPLYFNKSLKNINSQSIENFSGYTNWDPIGNTITDYLKYYLECPLTLIQGSGDIAFCGGGASLSLKLGAIEEGPNRQCRGVNSYFTAAVYAANNKLKFNWNIMITQFPIGHNGYCITNSQEAIYALTSDLSIMADNKNKELSNGCCLNVSA